MKKGLITALGTIALAIAGNGFALAPTIDGVPDIIIGDLEDYGGVNQTVDMNFFRLNDALNLMTYVNPTDSTSPGQLIFAFDEAGTGDTLDVNGVKQVTNPSAVPSAWDNKINNSISGSFMLSFRNIALSPRRVGTSDPPAGPAFPAPAQAETSRDVTLLIGDESDQVCPQPDLITVYTKDNSADALSGTYTTIFTQSAFPGTGATVWTFDQAPFTQFAACTSSTGAYLGIASGGLAGTAKSGAYYERWWQIGSPALTSPIPHVDGNIVYCAKMRLSMENVTSSKKGYAPNIRFGVENTSQNLITANLLFSENFGETAVADDHNPQLPNLGEARDYRFYWSPNPAAPDTAGIASYNTIDWRRWRLYFDIIDSDTNSTTGVPEDAGTWKISYVEVGYIPRPADKTLVPGSSTDFELTDLTSGTRSNAGGGFAANAQFSNNVTVTQNSPSTGKVTLNMGAASGGGTKGTIMLWERNPTNVTAGSVAWQAGKIVRVTARLSCPAAADRTNFSLARIGLQPVTPWCATKLLVRREPGLAGAPSNGATAYVPALTADAPNGTPYECYVASAGGPNAFINSLVGLIPNDPRYYILSIDHVAAGATDPAMAWTIHSVRMETLDESTMMP